MNLASQNSEPGFPPRFIQLKQEIAGGREAELTASWGTLLDALKQRTEQFIQIGSNFVPQVEFSDLATLSADRIADIKRKGSIVVRGVVSQETALAWKEELKTIVADNPDIVGLPEDDKQFFFLYWTRPQVQARVHPNVLKVNEFLNSLFISRTNEALLTEPLSYADRFRIRKPHQPKWTFHSPHMDGGSIERWEDAGFRRIYKDILAGNWQQHDAFDLDGRVDAQADLYDRPNQASVFRSFQGWLSMSDTGPGEGTLRVYPDVQLSNSYLILRPFFSLVDPNGDIWDKNNWKFDISTPDFPGIIPHKDGTFHGPKLMDESHPNMRTGDAMISVPRVQPGDMVFWHSDLVHSVEEDHFGEGDSSVMYIAAVPSTPQNIAYIIRQRDAFVQGKTPPDYGKDGSEAWVKGVGTEKDVVDPVSRRAMGFDR